MGNYLLVTHYFHTGLAQLVEQRSPKPQAAGSSPVTRASSYKVKK